MKNIVLFASGSGTNVENIVNTFKENDLVHVSAVFVNKPDAYVLERAKRIELETFIFNRDDFKNSTKVLDKLAFFEPDLIVLAGFLWLMPSNIVKAYPGKIINIHPALLPKYGGKGMYGMKVHEAVVENKEPKSGITIHSIDENYDEGSILFQAECVVSEEDSPEDVATKVHALEYKHFPEVIADLLKDE